MPIKDPLKRKESQRKYYEKNKEHIKENSAKWAKENKEKVDGYKKKYFIKNKEKILEKNRNYARKKRVNNIYTNTCVCGNIFETRNHKKKYCSNLCHLTEGCYNLSDTYVKTQITKRTTLSFKEIPRDMISLKRALIKLRRLVRKTKLKGEEYAIV